MQVAAKMGGLSLGEADVLRRAMSKKNRTKMMQCEINLSMVHWKMDTLKK